MLLKAAPVLLIVVSSSASDWSLWGGPNRDFQVKRSGALADSWPAGGPVKLWQRQLGEGYSAIAVRGNILYTMYRREAAFWQLFTPGQEVVAALDARTGTTKWELAYDAPFGSAQGPGPHAMPQIVGDLLFSVGATGKLLALDANTGRLVWHHDLYEELGGTPLGFGYSSHPLPYGGELIVVAGGKSKAVAGIDQKTGRVLWAGQSFWNSYSSPVLINSGGRDQVFLVVEHEILGIDPRDGAQLWSRSTSTGAGTPFCTTPLWDSADRLLIFSAAYGYGTTALRIGAEGGQYKVEVVWHDERLQSLFGNLLLDGDTLYLSRGFGPAFVTAVDVKTGKMKWTTREFARASFVQADGKLIILDEDGWLALAKPKEDGSLQVLAKSQVLANNAWTVPTVAGTTMYLRDRKVIMALNIGKRQVAATRPVP